MLLEDNVSKIFWREVVSTVVYILNQALVKTGNNKTPYELWYGKTPCVIYFKIFGSQCFIKRDNYTEKFDAKSDEGIFLGYSFKSKAYKCYNKRTKKIVESANVKVNDLSDKSNGTSRLEPEKDDYEENIVIIEPEAKNNEESANAELGAQPVSDDSEEEYEEHNEEDAELT
ncbi:hypothetical protein SUGI_0498500 [Cryptomeria japonica]|nr:hypothetical protein SUGI_0498500 [Cryptomeria japonica]